MTKQEQIEEMASNIKLSRKGICLDGVEGWVYSTPWQIAEDLHNAGYHKTIWHKVADGDLPEYAGPYLVVCGDESLPEYDVDFYENFWHGKRWVHNEGRVIAWTELPEYKERQI